VPFKVEYFLTDMGKTILPIVSDIWRWGREHMQYYYEKFLAKDRVFLNDAGNRKKAGTLRKRAEVPQAGFR
jgi:hypothetical protein